MRSGEDYEEVQPENVKVIEDFQELWYQKKCLRENNIPWKVNKTDRGLALIDPLLWS